VTDERPAVRHGGRDRLRALADPQGRPTSSKAISAASSGFSKRARDDHPGRPGPAPPTKISLPAVEQLLQLRGPPRRTVVSEGRFEARGPSAPSFGVLDDQHDGSPEVRVAQRRARDQQLSLASTQSRAVSHGRSVTGGSVYGGRVPPPPVGSSSSPSRRWARSASGDRLRGLRAVVEGRGRRGRRSPRRGRSPGRSADPCQRPRAVSGTSHSRARTTTLAPVLARQRYRHQPAPGGSFEL